MAGLCSPWDELSITTYILFLVFLGIHFTMTEVKNSVIHFVLTYVPLTFAIILVLTFVATRYTNDCLNEEHIIQTASLLLSSTILTPIPLYLRHKKKEEEVNYQAVRKDEVKY